MCADSDLFEGDIQLDPEEAALVKENPEKGLNQITIGRGAWPNGIVPYVVDANAKFSKFGDGLLSARSLRSSSQTLSVFLFKLNSH